MARHSKHTTEHTVGEVQAIFEDLIASVGGSFNNTSAQRVLALPIDGVPLRDHHTEVRKPDSNFYAQPFLEALATARILVALDMDSAVTNIERRDRPDIRVAFADGSFLYVEHTSVGPYDGMSFERHLEEINIAVRNLEGSNDAFRRFCAAGNLTVRLTDPGVVERVEPLQIAEEVVVLTEGIKCEVKLRKPDRTASPTLFRYQANVFYHPARVWNPTPCQQDGAWIDPRPAWVGERLRTGLSKKRERANEYDPNLRPLWLLITLDAERELFPPFVSEMAQAALGGIEIAPYGRVIVSYPGAAVIIEPPV